MTREKEKRTTAGEENVQTEPRAEPPPAAAPAHTSGECAESIAYEQACLFILSLGYHWSDAEETWVKTDPQSGAAPVVAAAGTAGPVAWFEDMPADAAGLFSVRVRPGFSPQADAPLYAAPSTAPPAPAGADALLREARARLEHAASLVCFAHQFRGLELGGEILPGYDATLAKLDAFLKDSGGGK